MSVRFLTVSRVVRLHELVLQSSEGMPGLRDRGLLISAVEGVRQSFGGEYVYSYPYEMAAAYLFGIVKNHAFLDANKRTGVLACLYFLEINGFRSEFTSSEVEQLAVGVANNRIGRQSLVRVLQKMCSRR